MSDEKQAETANTQDTGETPANSQGRSQAGTSDELATLRSEIAQLRADLEAREARLKEVNQESASRRHENKTLQETLEGIKAALEAERKQREEAETAKREAERQAERQKAISTAANKFNLPEAVAELLKGETPEELEAHAKALAESLGAARPAGGGKTGSAGNSAWQGGLTRDSLATMSAEQINERWDEVSKLLESGQ